MTYFMRVGIFRIGLNRIDLGCWQLTLSRSNYGNNDMARNRKEALRYDEVCDNIYRSSLPYKVDSVNIVFQ